MLSNAVRCCFERRSPFMNDTSPTDRRSPLPEREEEEIINNNRVPLDHSWNIMPHPSPPPPLPVTIVIRNFFPPLVALSSISSSSSSSSSISSSSLHNTKSTTVVSDVTDSSSIIPLSSPVLHKTTSYIIDERYTLASRRVLRQVRLDIIAQRRCSRRKLLEEEEEEVIMYSSTLIQPSSHPRWDHIDEKLQLVDGESTYLPHSSSLSCGENDDLQQQQQNQHYSYSSDTELYARFLVLLDDDENNTATIGSHDNQVEEENDDVNNDCSDERRQQQHIQQQQQQKQQQQRWTMMVEISLDSPKLCRLPNNVNDNNNSNNNNMEEEEDDNFNNSIQIPNTLPLNAILIYYNDGYTRILPSIYHVLLQKQIIYDKIPQKNHINGSSFSSIDHDKLFNLLEDGRDNNYNNSMVVVNNGSSTAIDHVTEEDKIIDSTNMNGNSSTALDNVQPLSSKGDELPLLPQSIPESNKAMKIEKLRQLIQIEQQLVNHDEQRIIEGRKQLRSIIEQVELIENEIHKAEETSNTIERVDLFRNEIQLETNRIQLVQQLRCIFPIRVIHNDTSAIHPPNYPKQQYMIANLPFPDDIHTPIVSDDQISSALGYVCQLVALVSKYLDVPLRYTLICKASRSAILFVSIGEVTTTSSMMLSSSSSSSSSSRGMVYPLFRERGVIDREQLDYGITLLDRNVNCLLRVRNISYSNEWNLLAKIDRLLVHVIDGE